MAARPLPAARSPGAASRQDAGYRRDAAAGSQRRAPRVQDRVRHRQPSAPPPITRTVTLAEA